MRAERRFAPAYPAGVPPAAFFGGLAAPLILNASLGVQLFLVSVLVVDPPVRSTELLTQWGRMFYFPEREVDLYVAGVTLAMGLGLVLSWAWGRVMARGGVTRAELVRGSALRSVIAIGATAWFFSLWLEARGALVVGGEVSSSRLAAFAALGCVTLAAAWPWEIWLRPRPATSNLENRSGPSGTETAEVAAQPGLRFSILDVAVPALIFFVVYIPAWRQLSGRVFLQDGLFHWDYYAMAPALAYQQGKALGTDFYAMYGLGWPAFFGLLSRWVSLSYGRLLQIGTLYACIYFAGVYLLLRLLLRRPWLAAAGTGVAMLQLFLGMGTNVIWVLPSLTVLRWAFDVWCFIALVLHRKTGNRIWVVLAGALVGLAVLVSTDTGLYLAAAVAFYWLCTAWGSRDAAPSLSDVAWSVAAAAGTLAAGIAVAARGTLLTGAFWSGWLEPLRDYRGGFAQTPLATAPDALSVTLFAVLLFVYLAFAGHCLAKVLYRRAGSRDILTGTFAVYGLMNLIHFVGRSSDTKSIRLALPLALILALLGGDLYGRAEAAARRRWGRQGQARILAAATVFTIAVALATLLVAPASVLLDPVKAYPNLLSHIVRGSLPDGLCLLAEPRDICGLPAALEGPVPQFQAIARQLKRLDREGKSLAVVDETGSLFYLASGSAPFGRYPRVLVNMYTKQNERRVAGTFTQERPQYVLTRSPSDAQDPNLLAWTKYFGPGPGADSPYYPDTYADLLNLVRANYRPQERIGPFELWALRN